MVGLLFPLLYCQPVRAAVAVATAAGREARAYCYQDDLDMVHEPEDTAAISHAFETSCAKFRLRSNRGKETITPGRELAVLTDLPAGYRVEAEPKVLRHGRCPVPVVPRQDSLPGSQLGESAPEVACLRQERLKLFTRIQELTSGGL